MNLRLQTINARNSLLPIFLQDLEADSNGASVDDVGCHGETGTHIADLVRNTRRNDNQITNSLLNKIVSETRRDNIPGIHPKVVPPKVATSVLDDLLQQRGILMMDEPPLLAAGPADTQVVCDRAKLVDMHWSS